MLEMKPWIKYTIICTTSPREVSRDYPNSKIALLADKDKDGLYVLAVIEKEY